MNGKMLSKLYVLSFLQLCISLHNSLVDASDIIVTLPEGQLVGITEKSSVTNSTRGFYSFLGVRYAQPPIGELRFKPPQPVQAWEGIYDARTEKNICYQVSTDNAEENEDCLFMNIFTPLNPQDIDDNTEPLPVMLVIHGGGFVSGSGQKAGSSVGIWSPDFFMDYGVILVIINYRLGPFGFFSTGDDVIPGNMGLKDQNLAIQWTKNNIKTFGGNPDHIVIVGQSAGAASVAYQILSPKSAGLFKGAICESAGATSPWAYQRNQTNITFATAGFIDERFNDLNNRNSTELLNFLLTVPASQIDQASYKYSLQETLANQQIGQGFFYAPVIEVAHEDAFITELMYGSLENGNFNKVPLMIGMNAEEAVGSYVAGFEYTVKALQQQPEYMVPHDMHLSGDTIKTVGNLIKAEYIEDVEVNEHSIAQTIKFFSDHWFNKGIIKHAQLQSKYSDVFFYQFSHHGYMGGNHVTYPGTGNVTHSEELPYLYAAYVLSNTPNTWIQTSDLTQFPKEDVDVHYRMMALWSNFVKYLHPTPTADELLQNVIWPTVDGKSGADLQYLNIGEDLAVKTNPRGDVIKFWDKLYEDYAVKPYDTY